MKSWPMEMMRRLRALLLTGGRFYCPLCGKGYRRFLPGGSDRRRDARCPGCGSLERHRLLWVALDKLWAEGRVQKGGALLHVAPEKALGDRLRGCYDYLSADMDPKNAMVFMDITSIEFPDSSFDAIICNHVLEHVPQDRKALAELYRVLKPGGWASIQVPMEGERTEEDLSITSAAQRARLYGQADHVRKYGTDFMSRLREAGFDLILLTKTDLLDSREQERLSVACENEVILVQKRPSLPGARP